MLKGIDVSHDQGASIDWKKVKKAGNEFAFIKATQGATFVDPCYARNRAQALAAGVLLASYHFFTCEADWGAQAHNFVSVVGKLQSGELPPILDFEDRDGIVKVGTPTAVRRALAWLQTVEDHMGARPVIYADRDFIKKYLQEPKFAEYPLWVASYTAKAPVVPAPWKHIAFWQYSEHGTCLGVPGEVDLDYFVGDVEALQRMAVK